MKLFFTCGVILLLLLSGCRKEFTRPSWEVDMTGPVIHSSLGIGDLIPDSLLQVNPDSSVTLVFDETIYRLALDSIVNLPDTTMGDTFKLPTFVPSVNVAPNQVIFSQTEEQHFGAGDVELTEAILRRGELIVQLYSTIDEPVQIEYQITTADLGGSIFSVIVEIPAGSVANPALVDTVFDMSNYHMNLRGSSGTSYNAFGTNLIVRLSPNASNTQVHNYDEIRVLTSFSDLSPKYVKGYFGSRVENIPSESASFSLFEKITGGTLDIDQVNVSMVLRNYIGADARITLNQVEASNSISATALDLTNTIIGTAVNINRAIDNWSNVSPGIYTIQLNEGNSNIDQILELFPDIFNVDMSMEINPLGNVSAHNDFMYDDQTFEADLNITMPLSFIANNLSLADTIDIDIQEGENGRLTQGSFFVDVSNGFPLGGTLQLYFFDGLGNLTDSIVSIGTIPSAQVNASQIVTSASSSTLRFDIHENQMNRLYAGDRMVLKVVFNTSSLSQHVTIYDHYRIDLRIWGDFSYLIGHP